MLTILIPLVKEVFALLQREGKLLKVSETLYYDAAEIALLQKNVTAFIEKEGEIDGASIQKSYRPDP